MQQETLGVPPALRWRPETVRGIPRRWRHAVAEFAATAEGSDQELVGLLWNEYPGEPQIEVLHNSAATPEVCFEAAGSLASGVVAVVHSHPRGCAWPSVSDQAQQIATGVAWIIAPRGGEPFGWGGLIQPEHLLQRPFRWGVTDCWGAVRDGLRSLYGVSVSSYPRAWQFWRDPEGALFEGRIRAEGFEVVSDDLAEACEGDVVLFRLHAPVYNHAGLVVPGRQLYHHPSASRPFDPTQAARVEPLERWGGIPCGVCRRVS